MTQQKRAQFEIDMAAVEDKRLIYVTEDQIDRSDFHPPSCWMVRDATGGRMYFKVRTRQKAQELCDGYYGKICGVSKYTIIVDKPAQIR